MMLRYTITNASNQGATAYLYDPWSQGEPNGTNDPKVWFSETLTDQDGNPAPSLAAPPFEPHGDEQYGDQASVQAQNAATGYLLVNQRLAVEHPGVYTLKIQMHLYYDVGEPSVTYRPGESMPLEALPAYLVTNQFTFSYHVLPADPQRLSTLAETLRRQATQAVGLVEMMRLLTSLFALPEAQAAPSWQALLSDDSLGLTVQGQLVTRETVAQLKCLSSLGAVTILAKRLYERTQKPSPVQAQAAAALRRMYAANPKLRAQISALYLAHHVTLNAG